MKGKMLRVALVVAVLGALAAIPASTQVPQTSSQTLSDQTGGNLRLLLLVNRLELSRAQMETLRTAITGLLAQRDGLDQQRAAFVQEMIAFNGTAEELDARLATHNAEMASSREALRERAVAAVDTLKETLTMKQGEVLMNALPGLMGRLSAVSSRATNVETQAAASKPRSAAAGKSGEMTMQRGRVVVSASDGRVSITTAPATDSAIAASGEQTTERAAGVVGKIQSMAQRIRDRVAGSLGADAATSAPSVAPGKPMMGMMAAPTDSANSLQGVVSSDTAGSDDFGMLTISLSGEAPATLGRTLNVGQRLFDGLERLADVLELKLAAMS